MIGKKMWALCKKRKQISIFKIGTQKFVSDGTVLADITSIAPNWDIKDIAAAADISPDSLEGYKQEVRRIGDLKESEPLHRGTTKDLGMLQYSLNMNGRNTQPFIISSSSDGRLVCVDAKLIDIFKDTPLKTFSFGVLNDKPAVYVWIDGFCIGIIFPVVVDLNTVQDFALALATGATTSQEQNFLDSGGQMKLPGA